MRTIIKIVPNIPLGPYPQPELCGHDGKAPMSNKIKMIIRIVPNMVTPLKNLNILLSNFQIRTFEQKKSTI